MQRINTATKSVDLFGAGKHGFTTGNQQGGTPPTQTGSLWHNIVQEAIARPIEYAGLTLDTTTNLATHDHQQLTKAIYRLYRNWNPDLIGSPTTHVASLANQHTFRTHGDGNAADTWLRRQATTRLVNITTGSHAMSFEMPADSYVTASVKVVFVKLGTNSVGTWVEEQSIWLVGGVMNTSGSALLHSNNVAGATVAVGGDGVDHLIVDITLTSGTWNFVAFWDVGVVTAYDAP